MKPSRLIWLASAAAALLLVAVVAMFSPIHLQITFDNQTTTANAGMLNLPTTTPLPPTAIPATIAPSTAVPATPEPATAIPATPEPPPERRERHTATPELPTTTPVPATPEPTHALPIMQPPQISIVKRASVAEALPGDRFSYTLVVTNTGQGTANDVVISDDVPTPLKVVDLHSTKGDIVVNGQRVTAYPRTLAPGETHTYTIVVQIDAKATPGTVANTAIITTTTIGDDTGDNTSTTTVTISRPRTTQTLPPRLPTTADPTVLDTTVLIYWPLLVLAVGLLAFGVATRRGAFRQQTLAVTVSGMPLTVDAIERSELARFAIDIQLDPHDLARRWRAGSTTGDLVELVAHHNPHADHLAVSIAVQKVLQRTLNRTND